jgi:hypothetical protein
VVTWPPPPSVKFSGPMVASVSASNSIGSGVSVIAM